VTITRRPSNGPPCRSTCSALRPATGTALSAPAGTGTAASPGSSATRCAEAQAEIAHRLDDRSRLELRLFIECFVSRVDFKRTLPDPPLRQSPSEGMEAGERGTRMGSRQLPVKR